jgi:uncharacterized protein YjbI with pentapeptide repeats
MESLDIKKILGEVEMHKMAFEGEMNPNSLKMDTFYRKRIVNLHIVNVLDLEHLLFDGSLMEGCIFENVDLYRASFFETTIRNCRFEGCTFIKAEIMDSKIFDSSFAGCNFFRSVVDGEIQNCQFKNCNIDRMILTDSQITDTKFSQNTGIPILRDNVEKNVIWDT